LGFVDAVAGAGAAALIVHARAAILGGLTPKENREIPPLKYHYVHRLKLERPRLALVLNGGVADSAAAVGCLAAGLDGVMLGRAAYHRPALLAELEQAVVDPAWRIPQPWQIIERIMPYARAQVRQGVPLHSISRHMHGLMAGRPGAHAWRRFLSEVAARPGTPPEAIYSVLPLLNQGMAA
jgi:tRNA-dihydrouridine synthase A